MASGCGFLSLAVRQTKLPLGFARLAMFVKELRGMLMHLGRRVVNGGRALMRHACADAARAPDPLRPQPEALIGVS